MDELANLICREKNLLSAKAYVKALDSILSYNVPDGVCFGKREQLQQIRGLVNDLYNTIYEEELENNRRINKIVAAGIK